MRVASLLSCALVACSERAHAPAGVYPAMSAPMAPRPSSSAEAAPPPAPATLAPGCGKAATVGARVGQHITAAGRDRTYALALPDPYAPTTPYPVVFVLHGGGANAASARTQFDVEHVAAGRAIVVYPDAVSGNWDLDAATAQNRDVALFDALLLLANNTLCSDMRRVFVTGFSNGAYMANQLGCRRGDRIRGIASHAGGGPYENAGTYDDRGHLVCAGKAVAAMIVHGANDGTVAPAEGQKSLDHWTFANRCGGGSTPTSQAGCQAITGCFQPVVSCRIPGLGHALWGEGKRATWAFFDGLH